MKNKKFIFGMVNSVCLYLIYPLNKLLEVLSSYVSVIFSLFFFGLWFLHIIINIYIYYKFIKDEMEPLITDWVTIGKGVIIGSLGIIAILLVVSITATFKKYTYLNCEIPFRLIQVEDLRYFLFVIVYNIFLYELSNKVYKYVTRRRFS